MILGGLISIKKCFHSYAVIKYSKVACVSGKVSDQSSLKKHFFIHYNQCADFFVIQRIRKTRL